MYVLSPRGGRLADAGNSLRTDVRSGIWGAVMLRNPVGRRADKVACPDAAKIRFRGERIRQDVAEEGTLPGPGRRAIAPSAFLTKLRGR